MKRIFVYAAMLLATISTMAQVPENSDDRMICYDRTAGVRNIINIPDIPGYKTLKCDFHMHTVFADANVSPKGRVQEAWIDGLDVVCVSEHIGVHKTGIAYEDHNAVNKAAIAAGKDFGMLVVPGIEITRAKPFGHMNFLFVKDAGVFSEDRYVLDSDGNPATDKQTGRRINNEKTLRADIKAGLKQGCFIQWNHPGWPDKKCDMYDIHKEMIEKGQIGSVEICNHTEWYPKVLDWFDEYHIPLAANSDAHNPTSYDFGHVIRPMTLVFAKEYTLESLREAMDAGRMLAFWDNKLAGNAEMMEELIHSCLQVRVIDEKKGRIEVTNVSDIRLESQFGNLSSPMIFFPRTSRIITVKKGQKINFLNCYIGRKTIETVLW